MKSVKSPHRVKHLPLRYQGAPDAVGFLAFVDRYVRDDGVILPFLVTDAKPGFKFGFIVRLSVVYLIDLSKVGSDPVRAREVVRDTQWDEFKMPADAACLVMRIKQGIGYRVESEQLSVQAVRIVLEDGHLDAGLHGSFQRRQAFRLLWGS